MLGYSGRGEGRLGEERRGGEEKRRGEEAKRARYNTVQ